MIKYANFVHMIKYALTELFRKPGNLRQIYKQTIVLLFIHQTMCREEENISTS